MMTRTPAFIALLPAVLGASCESVPIFDDVDVEHCGDGATPRAAAHEYTPANESVSVILGQGATPEGELVEDRYRLVDSQEYTRNVVERARRGTGLFDDLTDALSGPADEDLVLVLADATAELAWRDAQSGAGALTFGFEHFRVEPTFTAVFRPLLTDEGEAAPEGSLVVDGFDGYQIFLVNVVVNGGNECADAALRSFKRPPMPNELARLSKQVVESGGSLEVNVLSNFERPIWDELFDPASCSTEDILGCIEVVAAAFDEVIDEPRGIGEMSRMNLRNDRRWALFTASLAPLR